MFLSALFGSNRYVTQPDHHLCVQATVANTLTSYQFVHAPADLKTNVNSASESPEVLIPLVIDHLVHVR